MSKDYSLSEILTGKTWIDGKPVYRKVIQMPGSGQSPYITDASNLNIDAIVSIDALGHNRDDPSIKWTTSGTTSSYNRAMAYNTVKKTLIVEAYYSYFPPDYLIIEYTKAN